MYCSSCGTQLDDNSRFCTQCGAATGGSNGGGMITVNPNTDPDRGETKRQIQHFNFPEEEYGNVIRKIRSWLQGEEFEDRKSVV